MKDDSLSDVYDDSFAKDNAKLSADYKCGDALEELSRYNYRKAVDSVGKPKRSECKCLCHTDANTLGLIDVPMHVEPCCMDDIGKQDNVYAKQIWNDAIEAAAKELDIIKDLGGAFLVRKLKK